MDKEIVNDTLAFDKKVPEKWLNEKSDFAVLVAFDQWSTWSAWNAATIDAAE